MSVAIPVYNGARYLPEAITSVLDQSLTPAEVKVYDNCSTDDSVKVARRLLPSADVVTSPHNRGAVANLNKAARGADPDAEFFAWLAADDRFAPDFLARCVAELERQPGALACLTGVRFIDPHGRDIGRQTDLDLASENAARRVRSFLRRPRWTEFYCLYRRESLLRSPLVLDEYGADVLLTWWFLLRSPLAVTTDLLLDYRVYPGKTVDEMASSLDPSAPRVYWRKRRLWRRLWEMTTDAGVDLHTAETARKELVLALTHRAWLIHQLEDVYERWPITRRAVAQLPESIRSRGHVR